MNKFTKDQRVRLKVEATYGRFSYQAGQLGRVMSAHDDECYVELDGYEEERASVKSWKEMHGKGTLVVPFIAVFHPSLLENI